MCRSSTALSLPTFFNFLFSLPGLLSLHSSFFHIMPPLLILFSFVFSTCLSSFYQTICQPIHHFDLVTNSENCSFTLGSTQTLPILQFTLRDSTGTIKRSATNLCHTSLFLSLPLSTSIYMHMHMHTYMYLRIFLSLSLSLSHYLTLCLSPSVSLSISISLYLSLSLSLFVCVSPFLSLSLFLYLSPSFSFTNFLSLRISLSLSLSFTISLYLSLGLSVWLPI